MGQAPVRIEICHAPPGEDEKWVTQKVSIESLDGHRNHPNDILPAIPSLREPGSNWPSGLPIWANGCALPTSPTPTASPAPTPTPTGGPALSPSMSPSLPSTPSPTATSTASPTPPPMGPPPGSTLPVTGFGEFLMIVCLGTLLLSIGLYLTWRWTDDDEQR